MFNLQDAADYARGFSGKLFEVAKEVPGYLVEKVAETPRKLLEGAIPGAAIVRSVSETFGEFSKKGKQANKREAFLNQIKHDQQQVQQQGCITSKGNVYPLSEETQKQIASTIDHLDLAIEKIHHQRHQQRVDLVIDTTTSLAQACLPLPEVMTPLLPFAVSYVKNLNETLHNDPSISPENLGNVTIQSAIEGGKVNIDDLTDGTISSVAESILEGAQEMLQNIKF